MGNLVLKKINKIYPNGVQAVFDFNFEIKDKEFVVFVGPSGCGKSTTLRMIAGLETITSGEFYIDGELMNQVEPMNRNVAMVFQNYALYPHMTVYGNMKFALKLRKVPRPVYTNLGDIKDIVEENWMSTFEFPVSDGTPVCDINSIIDENDENIQPLSLKTHYQLKVWQKFIDLVLKHNLHIPAFPIWAMEFGASYRYKDLAPAFQQRKDLRGRKGKLGWIINGPSKADCLAQLPIYAQTATDEVFPDWKIRYIEQNRTFYEENERWLKGWRRLIEDWDNSHQKLEWNCGGDDDGKIFTKIIQFRASGIRVKLPTYSPALNLVGTQIPIIPWVKLPKSKVKAYTKEELEEYGLTRRDVQFGRYLSTREAAMLQGMEDLDFNGLAPTRIYEALGNAVNTQVVEMIARSLIQRYCYGKD